MESITARELKAIQLMILTHVRDICQENHLRYFLCGGTLLGAIRHGGFIPWDDDIDVFMPRPDYERFMKCFKTNRGKYALLSFNETNDYYYTFAKVVDTRTVMIERNLPQIQGMGVCIDVFPIDGLPNSSLRRKLHILKIMLYRKMLSLAVRASYLDLKARARYAYLLYPIWLVSRAIGYRKWLLLIDRTAKRYEFGKSNFVGCCVSGYGFREVMPLSVVRASIKVDFEDQVFDAPLGYHIYLSNLYGNYMELPPPEKRVPRHDSAAYWKENLGDRLQHQLSHNSRE